MSHNRSLDVQLDSMIWTNIGPDSMRVLKEMRSRDALNEFSLWFKNTLKEHNLDFDAFFEDEKVRKAILLICSYTMHVDLGKPKEEPEIDL